MATRAAAISFFFPSFFCFLVREVLKFFGEKKIEKKKFPVGPIRLTPPLDRKQLFF